MDILTPPPPQVITALPEVSYENVLNVTGIGGTTGTITGIGTTVGTGSHSLALKFTLNIDTGVNFWGYYRLSIIYFQY